MLFGTPVAEAILASVHVRAHQQAEHMGASDLIKALQTVLCRKQEAALDQFEDGADIHLALDGFESVELPFDVAVAPGQRHRRAHGVVVRQQPFGEALQGRLPWHVASGGR